MNNVEAVIDWLYTATPKMIKKAKFPKHPTGQDVIKGVSMVLNLPYEASLYNKTSEEILNRSTPEPELDDYER